MKINRIAFDNFKCFEGRVELDGLGDVTPNRPILLFGGLNGAGKTTLLEAILLALYGKKNKTLFPTRGARREDYDNYIYSLVNNRAKEQTYIRPTMQVELGLSDVELGGITQDITIKRKWIIRGDDRTIFKEDVEILDQNGTRTSVVDEENYDEFIETELIPYGISQFFLFDGENIQDFVRDEDRAFADSLEEALGLSLHRVLEEDLKTTKRQILSDYNRDREVSAQLHIVEGEIEQMRSRREEALIQIQLLEEELEKNEERIEEIDRETHRISKVRADDHDAYETQKALLQSEKAQLEAAIASAIIDIPFAFMATSCVQVQEQLARERVLQDFLSAQQAIEPKISRIASLLFEGEASSPPLTTNQENFYHDKLRKILRDVLDEMPAELRDTSMLHGLSSAENLQVTSRIEATWPKVQSLARIAQQLNEIEPQLERILRNAARTNDPDVQRLYVEKGALVERNRAINHEITDLLRPQIQTTEDTITAKTRQLSELEKKMERTSSMKKQVDYCDSLIDALQAFSIRFREQRVEKLQAYTLDMLKRLSRKSDFVSRVEIIPEDNFSVRLYDGYGTLIDKTKISKGEKELVAISLIWALSRLANRELPLVIDTPLARLDSEHRQHIVENYYPYAGEQVILLSTDTELVDELYDSVKPFISKAFLIEKDSVSASSQFVSGYFN